MEIISQLSNYAKLIRLEKPIGSLLLLWPTLWALWIASNGIPPLKILFIFVLGTFLMRSAGCIINDLADQNFDGSVERTKLRPLATGAVDSLEAIWLFLGFALLAFLGVLFLNRLTIMLSFVALFLAILYPFTKRITHFPQLILGFAFGFGIPMAFAAVNNSVPFEAWFLYFIGILWPLSYDTMYAMVDQDDDEKLKLKSTALFFGKNAKLFAIAVLVNVLILLILFGLFSKLSIWYFVGLGFAAMSLIYQTKLLYSGDKKNYFKAFLNNNWFGLAVFLGICFSY